MVNPSPFINALIGKTVSHVWSGYGTALFIEFGKLTPTKRINGEYGNPAGELTLTIEWGWRIEQKRSILGGSLSSKKKWSTLFAKIKEAEVIKVEFLGNLPEISVWLSNGLRVVSFMTAEGQPEWALMTRNPFIGHLCVHRGVLSIDNRN